LSVGYGLGWRTFSFGGIEGFFHHGGYVQGMRSEMIFHPDSASGLVFLTNSEPARLNRLSLRFAEWWTENGHLSDRSHESVGRRDEASAFE
jgi:beta-lactamase class C